MKAFYLLALIIILFGCGELVNPEREAPYGIDRSDNDKFIPVFEIGGKSEAAKYTVLSALNNRAI